MGCGTPAIGSPIWGNPEVISKPEAGILMTERSAKGVVDAVKTLFEARMPTREATREYASAFSWDATTEGQIALFRLIMSRRPRP
jgi:glycosyltransferase involved in cell wall biosynthesis